MMHWDYGWGMQYGWFFMIIFWMLIIVLAFFFVKMIIGGQKREDRTETALDILKKRYARNEISREEFEKIKKDIV